jgi:hypothetical protein
VENPLARALVAGEFTPGDRITCEADTTSGTMIFATDRSTVVADASATRDARSRPADGGSAGGGPAGHKRSPLDLPSTQRPRGDGELVN